MFLQIYVTYVEVFVPDEFFILTMPFAFQSPFFNYYVENSPVLNNF